MDTPNAADVLLTRKRDLHPHKAVFICGGRTLSFRDLDTACRRFACFLRDEGIVPGDRILVALPDCLAFPVVFLGSILCGAMAVVVDATLNQQDISHIIADCEPRLLVTREKQSLPPCAVDSSLRVLCCDDNCPPENTMARGSLGNPHQPCDGDFAFMLYSSGSTGEPKGVPHGHRSLLLPCELTGKPLFGITGDDVIFSTSKLSFAYGLINSLAFPLYFGATAILLPGKPDPGTVLPVIHRHRPSIFFSVPTIFSRIILSCTGKKLELPMRLCCSAGEALPAAVFREWRQLTGLEIVDGIGSTELGYHFISNVPGQAVAGSAGRLIPGYRARLVDDDGNEVPSGGEGNLLISGETGAARYWNLPEKSAETMLADGFIRTGDIFLERDGCYYHRGRSDDLIKSDGRWVSPLVVEESLRAHPAVADCAVTSVSLGTFTRPCAFVVRSSQAAGLPGLARELKEHAGSRLPDYMCPVSFHFVDDLPRTPTGKVQRYRLREFRDLLRKTGNNTPLANEVGKGGNLDIRTEGADAEHRD